ncbi:MAG TPA: hypothetical protein VLH75_13240 [Longimicrobiales bacterium]|nr:hypothetical protein [Longimicrobiales bacterium]
MGEARSALATWMQVAAQPPCPAAIPAIPGPRHGDAPFILSPHDPNTLYAGLNELFKNADRGDHWRSLGDLTTRTDRRTLEIMGQKPDSFTLSLDDGIPYWPTISAVAESPFTPGVLYVGTDDGQVQVSKDDGRTWANVTSRIPGLPQMAWINSLHASKHRDGRVFLAANNYRNDDYANHLWRSDDHGSTWTSVAGDLPANRVARTLRDDPCNPDVLYLGTEFGVFWSWNGGANWVELRGGLPTVAVNDLLVHPRDNDLVLATHNRGVWILDQANALQEMTPAVAGRASHLFSVEPSEEVRYRAHTGNMIFEGANPPAAAILDYRIQDEGTEVPLTVHDATGAQVAKVQGTGHRGINRALWTCATQLASRASGLRSSVEAWMGPLTADHASQKAFFAETLATLTREWEGVRGRVR